MWLRNPFAATKPGPDPAHRRPSATRLAVEALEDRSVPASLSISDVRVWEGTSGTHNAAAVVRLSAPSNRTVRVDYSTASGFGTTATPGSDYDAVSGRLTFAPGETAKAILVPVHGDQAVELDETFQIRLHNPKGAKISDGSALVTIQDSSPRVTIYGFGGSEASGTVTFGVYLSAASDLLVTVNYYTYDGDALAGQDYVSASGTLTFAPGETTKTITVDVIGDTIPEADEVFYVDLAATNALFDYYESLPQGWISADV